MLKKVTLCDTCESYLSDNQYYLTLKIRGDKVKNQPPDLTAGEFNRGE